MAIDFETEPLIDIATASGHPIYRHPRTGRKTSEMSVYRHIRRGARAVDGSLVKLEAIRTPNGMRTSNAAIERFVDRLTNPGNTTPTPSTSTRRKQLSAIEKELVADGFEIGEPAAA